MRSSPDRILVWMCVLIAVNQLGFGGIVPVLALSALRRLDGANWCRQPGQARCDRAGSGPQPPVAAIMKGGRSHKNRLG
jgi:hypothetical protein